MSGTFPGDTAVENKIALEKVILQKSTEAGKILALPLIEENILYVTVLNRSFNFDASQDRSGDIAYSIEFIKTGVKGSLKLAPLSVSPKTPSANTSSRGQSLRTTVVIQGARTLRSVSQKVYGTPAKAQQLYDLNAAELHELVISGAQIMTGQLPLGTRLKY